MPTVAEQLEQLVSLGIFVVAIALTLLSGLAYRRERTRRMLLVTGAYAMFAVYGLVVFLEYLLLAFIPYRTAELLEHGSAILVLAGLVVFFVAIARE